MLQITVLALPGDDVETLAAIAENTVGSLLKAGSSATPS